MGRPGETLGELRPIVAVGCVQLLLGEVAGALQVGGPEVGALQVGALEVGALQVGAPQGGAPQVGAMRSAP